MPDIFESVRYLKGVGEARARQLSALGIETIYDLLCHFPRTYEDRSRLCAIAELEADVPACFRAFVVSSPNTAHIRKGLDLTRITVSDGTAKLKLTFFNQKYAAENLKYGKEYFFYGTLDGDYTGYSMTNPVFEDIDSAGVYTRRIVPVYPLTAGVSNKLISKTVQQALTLCGNSVPETIPEQLRKTYGLCSAREAYRKIHQPESFDDVDTARRRLVFEEFFIFSAGLSLMRSRRSVKTRPPYADTALQTFFDALPFELTGAQKRSLEEICEDLRRPHPMNRLLQGDVGSGKTIVAAAAAYLAARNGEQTAFMAPTEILAEQHARSLEKLMERFGITVTLLTGSMTAAQKRTAREALADGRAQIVIGTHALISEATQFSKLGLVIADEQHRFGVAQRAALAAKGDAPHLLVMSATPIPRTLSLILYKDLDISVINELPPGRQSIDTFLVDENMRARINAFIRKQVAEGHQCYIVCPAIEENEEFDSLKSAEVWAETLQQTVFPDLRVALMHGRMKGAEKEAIMGAFARNEYDILVSTTVIEVGVDVPNATLMVVENADRFGLSQLHQLRGRVGRGSAKSYCVLFSSNRNPETRARLKALCGTNDGFKIAEQDLALRGPGDLFGQRQSGLPAFKVGSLSMDMQLLKDAQTAAADFLQIPDVDSRPEYAPLLARIRSLFETDEFTFN